MRAETPWMMPVSNYSWTVGNKSYIHLMILSCSSPGSGTDRLSMMTAHHYQPCTWNHPAVPTFHIQWNLSHPDGPRHFPSLSSMAVVISPEQRSCWGVYWFHHTPRTTKLLGGILVSLCPSVRPSRLPCPLCNIYSSGWILSILATNDHYHERVCRTQ